MRVGDLVAFSSASLLSSYRYLLSAELSSKVRNSLEKYRPWYLIQYFPQNRHFLWATKQSPAPFLLFVDIVFKVNISFKAYVRSYWLTLYFTFSTPHWINCSHTVLLPTNIISSGFSLANINPFSPNHPCTTLRGSVIAHLSSYLFFFQYNFSEVIREKSALSSIFDTVTVTPIMVLPFLNPNCSSDTRLFLTSLG